MCFFCVIFFFGIDAFFTNRLRLNIKNLECINMFSIFCDTEIKHLKFSVKKASEFFTNDVYGRLAFCTFWSDGPLR